MEQIKTEEGEVYFQEFVSYFILFYILIFFVYYLVLKIYVK